MTIKGDLEESKKRTEEKDSFNNVLSENTAEEKKIDISTLDDDDEFEDFQAEGLSFCYSTVAHTYTYTYIYAANTYLTYFRHFC